MGLKFKKINFKNWKCYRDQSLSFNIDSKKNISIIFGLNGSGKTSILEGLTWCLYGNEAISKDKLEGYFNTSEIEKNSQQIEIKIQIILEDERHIYRIERKATRTMQNNSPYISVDEPVLYLDLEMNEKKDPRERIEVILPKACREFFFFDGVEIKRYAELIQSSEIKRSIEQILGISELINAREDTESALRDLEREFTKASKSNSKLAEINKVFEEQSDELETCQAQLGIEQQEAKSLLSIINNLENAANQYDDVKEKIEQLERAELDYHQTKENIKKQEEEIKEILKKSPIVMMKGFIKELEQELQRKTISVKQSGTPTQLKKILQEQECICGRCLDDDSRQYILTAIQELEKLDSYSIQKRLEQDNLKTELTILTRFEPPDLNKKWLDMAQLKDNEEGLEQNINRIKGETQGFNQQEGKDIWRKLDAEKDKLRDKNNNIKRLTEQIEILKKEIDRTTTQRQELAKLDKQTKQLTKQIATAKGLYQATQELVDWYSQKSLKTIQEKTSELLCQITNKPDEYQGVRITEDYTLQIETTTERLIRPDKLSAGEKETLAYSFIAGLNLASDTASFLVMDTPFGHLDLEHQRKIILSLPKMPSQVVILAMPGRDIPEALLQDIKSSVSDIYYVERLEASEYSSRIRKDDLT